MLRHKSLHPLSHQHHNGLALCVMGERSLAADAAPTNVRRLAARAVEQFDSEITNHFGIEERILFPAVERDMGPLVLISQLTREHRELEHLAGVLRETPAEDTLRDFYTLLRLHIRKEENDLFEEVQRSCDPETLTALGPLIEERAVRICLKPDGE